MGLGSEGRASLRVPQAILDTIRREGFHIGETVVLSLKDGHARQVANAVDAKTGESFVVLAPTMYNNVQ